MHLRQDKEMKPLVEKAQAYLRKGGFEPREIVAYADALMTSKGNGFHYARRILHRLLHNPKEQKKARISFTSKELANVREQYSLCTYKDKDLPIAKRLYRALEILQFGGVELDETASVETLGQAGSIYRQLWQHDLDRQNLHNSYDFFHLGYEKARKNPKKYRVALAWTGINAAYVLDKLAKERAMQRSTLLPVEDLKQRARKIRHTLIKELTAVVDTDLKKRRNNEEGRMPASDLWWLLSTLGQAHYALGKDEWEEAIHWFKKARRLKTEENIPTWQVEATSRRIVNAARVHGFKDDATDVLRAFLGKDAQAITTIQRGKMGLALSGGGFRASFFHLGVLARLAEQNQLKDVEVISCVSGGSVVGACYYLKLRRLLEEKSDQELGPGDYVKLVEDLCAEFLEGIKKNLRTRLLSNFGRNFKVIFDKNYTRTHCAGELFEELLFEKVDPPPNSKPWRMRELFITPKRPDGKKDFHPRYDNFYRKHKVPILVLNASTLNTGHNWQFTISWMGEPPSRIDSEIDANERLRRFYFTEIKHDEYKDLSLGLAVAASACVPGVFDPVSLDKAYDEHVVRLVDGGVFDNQGIHALLEEDCDFLVISDASGQMNTEVEPSDGFLKVPLRSNEMLMQRVREVQLKELEARRNAGLLKVTFVHLKKDLGVKTVPWTGCDDPSDDTENPGGKDNLDEDLTEYHINEDNQRLLANIRTDLDVFNDVEAYALMSSGYRMLEYYSRADELDGKPAAKTNNDSSKDGGEAEKKRIEWDFLRAAPFLESADPDSEFRKILRAASFKSLRFWRIKYPRLFEIKKFLENIRKPALRIGGPIIVVILVVSAFLGGVVMSMKLIGIVIAVLVAAFALSLKRMRDLLLGTIAMVWAWLHLGLVSGHSLKQGEIERLEKNR